MLSYFRMAALYVPNSANSYSICSFFARDLIACRGKIPRKVFVNFLGTVWSASPSTSCFTKMRRDPFNLWPTSWSSSTPTPLEAFFVFLQAVSLCQGGLATRWHTFGGAEKNGQKCQLCTLEGCLGAAEAAPPLQFFEASTWKHRTVQQYLLDNGSLQLSNILFGASYMPSFCQEVLGLPVPVPVPLVFQIYNILWAYSRIQWWYRFRRLKREEDCALSQATVASASAAVANLTSAKSQMANSKIWNRPLWLYIKANFAKSLLSDLEMLGNDVG